MNITKLLQLCLPGQHLVMRLFLVSNHSLQQWILLSCLPAPLTLQVILHQLLHEEQLLLLLFLLTMQLVSVDHDVNHLFTMFLTFQ